MTEQTVNSKVVNDILDHTKAYQGHYIQSIYKESLRSLINFFSNLYYQDGDGNNKPIKCYFGSQERSIAALFKENNLVLPVITVTENSSQNSDDRRRYAPVLINEKYWDPKEQRAVRLISLSPRPVDVSYTISIWAEYKEDLDQIREAIFNQFNPSIELEIEKNYNTKIHIESEDDTSRVSVSDKEDRVLRKTINLLSETYIPSPKFLYTSTGKIERFNYEIELVQTPQIFEQAVADQARGTLTIEEIVGRQQIPTTVGGGTFTGSLATTDLTDVIDTPASATGHVLVWNDVTKKYEPKNLNAFYIDYSPPASILPETLSDTLDTLREDLNALTDTVDNLNFDGPYVNTSGDTMTGQLRTPSISSTIYYGPTDSTQLSNSATNATRLLLRTNDARLYTGGNLNFQLNATNADFYSGKFVLSNENNRFIAPAVSATSLSGITLTLGNYNTVGSTGLKLDGLTRPLSFTRSSDAVEVAYLDTAGNLGAYTLKLFAGTINLGDPTSVALVAASNGFLEMRNGINNPQSLRIYKTYSNATNFERANLIWDSNNFIVGTEAGSAGGTSRDLIIATSGIPRMFFSGTGHRIDIGDKQGLAGSTSYLQLNGYPATLALQSNGWSLFKISSVINQSLRISGRDSIQQNQGYGVDFLFKDTAISSTGTQYKGAGIGSEARIRLLGRYVPENWISPAYGLFHIVAINEEANATQGDVEFQFAYPGQSTVNLSAVSWWYRSGITQYSNTIRNYANSALNTSAQLLDLSATWNTPATPTAIKLNVRDVSSNANSLLMGLSTDNSSNFIVRKDGYTASRLSLASNGIEAFNTGDAALSRTSSARVIWLNADSGVRLGSGMAIKWASTSQVGAEDTLLSRVGPGVISATSSIIVPTVSATTYLNLSASIDALYVNQSGDTMTSTLTINAASSITAPLIDLQTESNSKFSVDKDGIVEQTSGKFSVDGDYKRIQSVMRGTTTDATQTELFIDGTTRRQVLPNHTAWNVTIRTVARSATANNKFASFDRKFMIARGEGAFTTQMIGPVQVLGIDTGTNQGSPPDGWDVTIVEDTTFGCFKVFVTGQNSTELKWVCEVNIIQVSYQGQSIDSQVLALFANGEEGAWYDPSEFDPTWRKNLLIYTEDLTSWTPTAGVTTEKNVGIAPDNTNTATRISNFALATGDRIAQNIVITQSTLTGSIYLKGEGDNIGKDVIMTAKRTGGTFTGASITHTLTNSWVRVSATFTQTIDNTGATLTLGSPNTNSASSVLVWGAQLERSPSATSYQRIVTPEITYIADVKPLPVLYQDHLGATPITNVEQTVGFILDKRKNLVLGSELTTTPSITLNGAQQVDIGLSVVSGQFYKVSATVYNYTGTGDVGFYGLVFTGVDGVTRKSANGTMGGIVQALADSTLGMFGRATNSASISGISVKLLDGNHAYQTLVGNRPVLRARYNNLTYSEQFENAFWSKDNSTVSSNVVSAPNGTITADKLIKSANAGNFNDLSFGNFTFGSPSVFSIHAKKAEHRYLYFRNSSVQNYTIIDLDNGSIVASQGWSNVSVSNLGSGWYRVFVTESTGGAFRVNIAGASSIVASYTNIPAGNGSDGIYIWGADLRTGTSTYPYQRIVASTEYDVGPSFPVYIDYATGNDDSLTTQNINLSSVSSMTIWAGVEKYSNATAASLISYGVNYTDGPGFEIMAPGSNNSADYLIGGSSNIAGALAGTATTYGVRARNVVAGRISLSATTHQTRFRMNVDGISRALSYGGAGINPGNFGNKALTIGARPSGVRLQGRIYGIIVRATETNNELLNTGEIFIANKMGVTL